jgi:opacity protein-like surface antigen
MKKLIVLSVIFALLAGSVFAADVGVEVHGGAVLIQGTNVEHVDGVSGDKPVYVTDRLGTGFGIGRVRIGVSGGSEDGTFGAWGRLDFSGSASGAGLVWWKPVEQVKVQLGQNPDGEFALGGGSDWGYHMLANEVLPGLNGHLWSGGYAGGMKYRDVFYGSGFGGAGLILNITPIEALAINIGIPLVNTTSAYKDGAAGAPGTFGTEGDYAYENWRDFTLQVTFDIDGTGKAGLTFVNGRWFYEPGAAGTPPAPGAVIGYDEDGNKIFATDPTLPVPGKVPGVDNPPKLFAYFNLTSVENLNLDIGLSYSIPFSYESSKPNAADATKTDTKTTTNNRPLGVGVAADYNGGAFGVKARVAGFFLQNTTEETTSTNSDYKGYGKLTINDDGWGMLIDVMPYYAVNEKFKVYFSTGVGFVTGEESVDNVESAKQEKWVTVKETRSIFGWHINPYVSISALDGEGNGAYWSATFFAGLRLESPAGAVFMNGDKGDVRNRTLNWSIPIGMTVSF